jgi:RNA polymerase sigma-70 factor (ECF subfamily)
MDNLSHQDVAFFDSIFRRHYKALKAYAYKYTDNTELSEDIVQDVFFELWLKRERLQIQVDIKSYLFKAVANKSINALKDNEERKISLEPHHEEHIQDFYLRSLSKNQEDYLLLNELNNEIKASVEKLPEQCKKIFQLRHGYGLKNREIAEQLNISIKAVEKQMTRALFEIREHLQRMDLLPMFVLQILMKTLEQ